MFEIIFLIFANSETTAIWAILYILLKVTHFLFHHKVKQSSRLIKIEWPSQGACYSWHINSSVHESKYHRIISYNREGIHHEVPLGEKDFLYRLSMQEHFKIKKLKFTQPWILKHYLLMWTLKLLHHSASPPTTIPFHRLNINLTLIDATMYKVIYNVYLQPIFSA